MNVRYSVFEETYALPAKCFHGNRWGRCSIQIKITHETIFQILHNTGHYGQGEIPKKEVPSCIMTGADKKVKSVSSSIMKSESAEYIAKEILPACTLYL